MSYQKTLTELPQEEKDEIKNRIKGIQASLGFSKSDLEWLMKKYNSLFNQDMDMGCPGCVQQVRQFWNMRKGLLDG